MPWRVSGCRKACALNDIKGVVSPFCRWSDGEADSWEDEENVSLALVNAWLSENGQQAVQLNTKRRSEQPRMLAKEKRNLPLPTR